MSTYVELITVCYKKPDTHCQNVVCVSSELIAVFLSIFYTATEIAS